MPCRSQVRNHNSKLQQYKSLGGGLVPLGAARSQTALRVSRTAKRTAPKNHKLCHHRPTGQSPPPGGLAPVSLCFNRYRLAGPSPPLGANQNKTPQFPCCRLAGPTSSLGVIPVIHSYWFSWLLFMFPPHQLYVIMHLDSWTLSFPCIHPYKLTIPKLQLTK